MTQGPWWGLWFKASVLTSCSCIESRGVGGKCAEGYCIYGGIYGGRLYSLSGETLLTQWSRQMGRVGPEQPVIANIFPEAGSTVRDVMETTWTQEKVWEEWPHRSLTLMLWTTSLAPSLSLSYRLAAFPLWAEFPNSEKIKLDDHYGSFYQNILQFISVFTPAPHQHGHHVRSWRLHENLLLVLEQSPLHSHPIQASLVTFVLEVSLFTLDRAYFHWSLLEWLWTQSLFPGTAFPSPSIWGLSAPSRIPGGCTEEQGLCKYFSSNPWLLGCPLNVTPHGGLLKSLVRGIGMKVKVLVFQLWSTPCDAMASSPPGSSVHEFLRARTLEPFAISFSRGSSRSRDWIRVPCIAVLTIWATREALQKVPGARGRGVGPLEFTNILNRAN